MKTATTFHSDFFNTDCLLVDGVPHFSVSGAAKTLYGNTGGIPRLTAQLEKTLATTTPSSATDLGDLPGICLVVVETPGMPAKVAHAMDEDTFTQLLWQYAEKKTKAGEYARTQLKAITGVAINLILKKEAGLVSEETTKEIDASIAQFFKPLPGNEKADPINEIKELLIANGQKDRCKRMGVLINELVYNRLPLPVYDEMIQRCGGWRRSTFKTNWQQLSSDTQKRIEDILTVAKVFIEDEMEEGQIFNFAPVIQKLDRVMPRHRSSGYCAV
jgi:hypothetical protein